MSDDKMQVGKVKLGTSASPAFSHVWCPTCHAYHTSDLHPPALPKLPKRVAVELRAGVNWTAVRSNDGIIYRWGYDAQDRENRWTRLPDLPQD